MPTMVLIDMLMCGLAAGVALAGVLALSRARMAANVRVSLLLTCLSALCLVIAESPLQDAIAGRSAILIAFLVIAEGGAVGFFWLAMRAVFEDRPVTPAGLAPGIVLMGLIGAGLLADRWTAFGGWLFWAHTLVNLALAVHIPVVILSGWRDDLVEGRRRLRPPLLAVCGAASLCAIGMLAASSMLRTPLGQAWMVHGIYFGFAGVAALFALSFDIRRSIFAPTPARTSRDAVDEDTDHLKRLERLMGEDAFWRREALSVGDLAAEMALPEHRLRKLINGRLGHRNFAAFINAYRIEAAMRLLVETRKTVAEIAFSLGFTSLNPFNRAFKETTGETPTNWRRAQKLVESEKDLGEVKSDETAPLAQARPARGMLPTWVN